MKLDYDIDTSELELIEKYLHNRLNREEQLVFDQKMRSDSNWQNKINETKLLLVGIQQSQLAEKLDDFHDGVSSYPTKGKVVRFSPPRWAIAASFLLVVSVAAWLLFTGKNSYEKLYADYYKADPGLLTAMGPATNYAFEKGMVEYKNEEYERALQTWTQLASRDTDNDTLNYFMAMAHQAQGRDAEAKKYLQLIVNDNSHAFYGDACWYLGLIELKGKETAAAIALIEKSTHPQKAALLEAIKKR